MDNNKNPNNYKRVTHSDAIEYFVDKRLSETCHLCGAKDFTVAVLDARTVPGFITQRTDDFTLSGVVPLVLLECKNCGNINTFRETHIYNYLRSKRGELPTGSAGND
ncbi:MAG: hypothetical protein PGN25_01055 [Methylorubrum populi]